MNSTTNAALAVGATLGLGALVLKLPLWAGIFGFAAGTFVAKTALDKAAA